jgi:hypothetical protein
VTTGESDLPLDIRSANRPCVNHGTVDIGAETGKGAERELADFLTPFIPWCAARKLVWNMYGFEAPSTACFNAPSRLQHLRRRTADDESA